jgi:hypothetical protein
MSDMMGAILPDFGAIFFIVREIAPITSTLRFEEISAENRHIILMEWIAEGFG